MDMNTIALIKGLAGNGGGGSSLPTNPAQDGTYALQNTVSSGTSTLSWASGGSSGGGVLVVHKDENGVLDKTWQEIKDAGLSVFVFNEGGRVFVAYCTSVDAKPPSWSVVYAGAEQDGSIYTVTFIANSADGYPAYSE